ncbi:MAG: bifunctional riboflavin kinase/FAD synthetase [Chitinophagaceae bacterium]|nr:bifunctional riboflavin kinase/FAD synthetase [Chitinophagaceae bacterium]
MIQVHSDLMHLPRFKNAVITIGTFDGVHLGHQQIIRQLKSEAASIGGETVIITFHPHPRIIVGGPSPVKILNTLEEKIELLDSKGIEHVVVIPFNEEFASQDAGEYITNFLVAKFQPHTIIIGYDHRFGKNRQGDYHLLEDRGTIHNYRVKEIPEHVLNEVIISSTRVREALVKSDIDTANKYLGYPYFFEGMVVEGNKLGRTLGYPTANLKIAEEAKLVPGNGVYAVQVRLHNKTYKGMMNIGVRPTVDGLNRMIEVNIFDFDQDIYGEKLRVTVLHHLRGEIKFNGLDALKAQLTQDRNEALKVLK